MTVRVRTLIGAVLATGLLAIYVWALGFRGWLLIRSGEVIGVALGVAILVIPIVCVWAAIREWHFASRVDALARDLFERGELPRDDLPKTPGGRYERDAADAQFLERKAEAEQDPNNWAVWFRLALAYDASRDRKRARASFRKAVALEKVHR